MEEEQERIINNSLPPPRHYFRGVAVRCGAGLEVVVTREHVAQQTAQHRTLDYRTPACMDGAGVCKSAPP